MGLATLAWAVQSLGAFEPLDRTFLDLLFVARGDRRPAASVVIVGIDHESLERVGHRWPWPRTVHARLVRQLAAAGASVVAFDILFVDEEPQGDPELGAAAEEAGNVVWASIIGRADEQRFAITRHQGPVPALRVPSSTSGYVNFPFDPDGYVRRVQPFRQLGSQMLESFAGAVAGRHRREPLLHLSAGGTRWRGPTGAPVPVEPDGSLLVNFTGPPGAFATVPYIRVLEGQVPAGTFAGRIVLVGAVSAGVDRFFTPFYSRLLPDASRLMPGVEIHAHAVDMLLGGRFLARAGPAWMLLLLAAIGLAAALVVGWWRPWLAAAAFGGAVLACLGLAYGCFAALRVWVPIAGPLAGAAGAWGALAFQGLAGERREREFVRGALERYVSPEVVREVMERKIDLALSGRRQTITVLFSDLRGFTGLSERIPPEAVVEILNEHFTAASEIVLRHGGTLDKFIGDAVMAFWNAPVAREDHALRAVRAALEMQAAAEALDARLRDHLGERLQLGVGINTGAAVVGHIGSPQRLGYTAVGDPVNLAARVESLTREHDAVILITQFTYELVKFDVEAEPLGLVPVRGRKEPVAIYRVAGPGVAGRPSSEGLTALHQNV